MLKTQPKLARFISALSPTPIFRTYSPCCCFFVAGFQFPQRFSASIHLACGAWPLIRCRSITEAPLSKESAMGSDRRSGTAPSPAVTSVRVRLPQERNQEEIIDEPPLFPDENGLGTPMSPNGGVSAAFSGAWGILCPLFSPRSPAKFSLPGSDIRGMGSLGSFQRVSPTRAVMCSSCKCTLKLRERPNRHRNERQTTRQWILPLLG